MKNSNYNVLFVCMGNICRSPAGEAVFAAHLAETEFADQVDVDSAGTIGLHSNSPADSRMQKSAKRRGYALTSRARQVNANDFYDFDLILAMDDENFADLQDRRPEDGRAEIRLFCDFCDRFGGEKDVPDPYYGGDGGFEHVLDLLEDGVDGLLKYIKSNIQP